MFEQIKEMKHYLISSILTFLSLFVPMLILEIVTKNVEFGSTILLGTIVTVFRAALKVWAERNLLDYKR